MIIIDTETVGLHSICVLIQYKDTSVSDQIILHEVFKEPVQATLDLIERFVNDEEGLVFFNAVFDWFHLIKLYNLFRLVEDKQELPIVSEIKSLEQRAIDEAVCLKPKHILDIFLYARKTKYQSCMERKNIRIKKIPNALVYQLLAELEKRIKLNQIYFARKKVHGPQWEVVENKGSDDFKDIVLKFKASSALKALAADALGIKDITYFSQISASSACKDYGFAHAHSNWPTVISEHIEHWHSNVLAREYAAKDVEYLHKLYDYFSQPPFDDNDSILTVCVANCRYRGYEIDIPKIKKLKEKLKSQLNKTEYDENYVPHAPKQVKAYIAEVMDDVAKPIFLMKDTTKKIVLKELINIYAGTEVAERAKKVINIRAAKYKINFFNKLLKAGRFFASFNVIGALSGRMSGGDKLNAQGIARVKEIRECFPLAPQGMILCGGDAISFEVSIAAGAYKDSNLEKDLCECYLCGYLYTPDEFTLKACPQCKGFVQNKDGSIENTIKKIHGLYGAQLFKKTYEEVLASRGTSEDLYGIGKNGVFTLLFGGTAYTLIEKYGVDPTIAEEGEKRFLAKYRNVNLAIKKVIDDFQSMRQPGGIGTRVVWKDPAESISTLLGFKRFFILENQICKALFELAESPPKSWRQLKIQVVRRDRVQLVAGAVQSALYATAFSIQSASTRAARNHVIQGTGAGITKSIQVQIWNLQPQGIHSFQVMPLNVHDEIMCPTVLHLVEKVKDVVYEQVKAFRSIVPLLAIDWHTQMNSWADK